jgi:hypothetical protein
MQDREIPLSTTQHTTVDQVPVEVSDLTQSEEELIGQM